MIPNVGRGTRMHGLMAYLVGPGKRNEHEHPHLVNGDGPAMAWWGAEEVVHEEAMKMARYLDVPQKTLRPDMTAPHVWHCSLSLSSREGRRTDQEWEEITARFMEEMGFHDGVKAPFRWVAVHHGVSAEGNDHVHIVADIIREDGTRLNLDGDAQRAQKVCRRLEREFGLEEVRGGPGASRGYKKGEREAEARRRARGRHEELRRQGRVDQAWSELTAEERQSLVDEAMQRETARVTLERKVRALASAAATEAEFVASVRREGVLVRPRFKAGSHVHVEGYSVAEKPVAGARPIWFGGSTLANDLSLGALRERWSQGSQDQREASTEWQRAWRGKRSKVKPATQSQARGGQRDEWEQAAEEIRAMRERLSRISVEDHEEWMGAAREASATFGAWSLRVEKSPGPLAHAADSLAWAARAKPRPAPGPVREPSRAAGLLMMAAAGRGGTAGQVVLMRQLVRMAHAIHDMHVAEQELGVAVRIERVMRDEVAPLYRRMPAVRTASGDARESASPRDRTARSRPEGEGSTRTTTRVKQRGTGIRRDDRVVPDRLERETPVTPRTRPTTTPSGPSRGGVER